MTAALENHVSAPAQPAPATEGAPAFDGHGPFVLGFTMFAVLVVIAAVLWK